MRTPPPPARLLLGRGVAFLALAAGCSLVLAAPDESADPVGKLLLDKGLIAVAAPAAIASAATATASMLATFTATAPPAAPELPAARSGLLGTVQERAADMVVGAMNFLGVRYQRGGSSAETGFDCSGFTRHVFENSLGLVLPRRADQQAGAPGLVAVARSDLQPGDLVFFNTLKRTFSHVGIYIGGNRFIHAPSSGKDVRTEDLSFAYWAKRFTGARRFEGPARGE